VETAQCGVKTLAYHLTVPDNDCANEGIRADAASTALSKLQSALQVTLIRGSKGRIHG
jgi:hypothetical protein